MTEKEKIKAYDEAIKRAKKYYGNRIAEEIFPELKESDDERIKKAIIEFFKSEDDNITYSLVKKKDIIAWLEKQGKNSTDKTPKFKVGDWVVRGDTIAQILDIQEQYYVGLDINGKDFVSSRFLNVDKIHLWTMQDAKDGDVIYYKDEISLYKNDIKNCDKQEKTFTGFVYYCCYDGKNFITNSFYSLTEQDKIDIYPATKEQRDALMKVMNNVGYEWNTENKELKKKKK